MLLHILSMNFSVSTSWDQKLYEEVAALKAMITDAIHLFVVVVAYTLLISQVVCTTVAARIFVPHDL